MNSERQFWIVVAASIFLALAVILAVAFLFDSRVCAGYGDITGRNVEYFVGNGCFVRTPEGLIPVGEYKFRVRANKGPL